MTLISCVVLSMLTCPVMTFEYKGRTTTFLTRIRQWSALQIVIAVDVGFFEKDTEEMAENDLYELMTIISTAILLKPSAKLTQIYAPLKYEMAGLGANWHLQEVFFAINMPNPYTYPDDNRKATSLLGWCGTKSIPRLCEM